MSARTHMCQHFETKMALRLFICLVIMGLVVAHEPNPTVTVPHGAVKGSWKMSTKGRSYASFEGIPYARPPVGKYRFREPEQPKPWTGIWDATRALSVCLQYDPFTVKIKGSEDCLHVNVYSPQLKPDAKLPVMVVIHGGAFMFGGGCLFDAAHVMDWDMVVVTFNYRLGPLGFLSMGDKHVPGNNGLKDQSFALHWVKNNIMKFGGNPDSVTLIGFSAGAASVHYHYLSPLSKGTFSRGIAFSGSALSSWSTCIKPAEKARSLAAIVGCPTETSKELLDCLKNRPAEVIVKAQIKMFEWKVHMFTPFSPVVEAPGVHEPFLQQYPYYATRDGLMMKVPLIASVTTEEGLYPAASYLSDPSLLPELESQWVQLAANIFEYNDTLPLSRRHEVAQAIKQHYLGGKPVSLETFPQLVQALGDRLFVADVGKMAQLHAKSGQPNYVYKYAYHGKSLSGSMAGNKTSGIAHGDDVLCILKYPGYDVTLADDLAMVARLINMIYTYSTTGIPKLSSDGPEWLPVKPGAPELNYLEILSPTKFEMKSSNNFGQKAFWDKLNFNEYEHHPTHLKDEL